MNKTKSDDEEYEEYEDIQFNEIGSINEINDFEDNSLDVLNDAQHFLICYSNSLLKTGRDKYARRLLLLSKTIQIWISDELSTIEYKKEEKRIGFI